MTAFHERPAFLRAAIRIGLAFALAFAAPAVGAQTLDAAPEPGKPLWEIGAGAVGAWGPDYPASDEYSINGLGFPFVLYRGEYLRIDDESARVVGIETPAYSFGVSAGGAFPARSEDNIARAGMPDLGYLGELGPELELTGPSFADGRGTSALAFQLRAVISATTSKIDYQGAVLETKLRGKVDDVLGGRVSGSVGVIFGSERLHDYFYEVDPAFATADRPAFDARGGYLGTQLSVGYSRDLGARTVIFAGASLGVHHGAANRNSPLFRSPLNTAVSIGLIHTFAASKTKVAQ